MLHIYQKEKSMITYQQICEQQTQYRTTLINRKRKLQELVGEFARAILDDLGLTGKGYRDEPLKSTIAKPYVRILELESGKQEDVIPFKLPVSFDDKGNPLSEAGICITLEENENTYPKTHIYIRIQFKLIGEQLILAFLDFDEEMQITVNLDDSDNEKWHYAVQSYKEMVMRSCTLPC